MKRRSLAPLVAVLAVLAAITGVLYLPGIYPVDREKFAYPVPAAARPSPAVDINVYVDVSGSMRNFFTNDGRPNTFQQFLTNCELALTTGQSREGWERRTFAVWKFGSRGGAKHVANDGGLRALANSPEQFDEPGSPIEAAINDDAARKASPGARKLLILVTDLYQSDGRLELPAKALIRNYLKNEKGAVAMYGVRNPYQGPVEDVPSQNGTILSNAATSMPFYIIIAGESAADVRHAQELLTGGNTGEALRKAAQEDRLLAAYFAKEPGKDARDRVIYDTLVRPPKECGGTSLCFSSLRSYNTDLKKIGAAEPLKAKARDYSVRLTGFSPDYNASGIAQIGFRGARGVVGISWESHVSERDPVWQTVRNERHWRVRALYCAAGEKGACKAPPLVDQRASDSVHVCNEATADGAMWCKTKCPTAATICMANVLPELAVAIDGSGLTRGRKYLIEIASLAGADELGAAFADSGDVMHRWNLNFDEIQALLRSRQFPADRAVASDPRPGKTPNLSQFLNALVGTVSSSKGGQDNSGSVLKTYYLYVNAR